MPLRNDVDDLALAVATEIKRNRTWINGNAADLGALSTTAKNTLVAAINEVNASVGSAAGIDDNTVSSSSTWSSQKTSDEIGDAASAVQAQIPTLTDLIDDITAGSSTVYSSTKTESVVAGAVGAIDLTDLIDDTTPGGATTFSSSETAARIQAAKDEILGGAGAAYDTLAELQALFEADDTQTAGILDALGLRVRVDAAQPFDSTQQSQARSNIAAASTAEVAALSASIGDLSGFDPVGVFEAALT